MMRTFLLQRMTWAISATLLVGPGLTRGQDAPPGPASESRETVEAAFQQKLVQLQKDRLDRLARLAEGQKPAEAAKTYELCLRHAIEDGLFAEAEPTANRVLRDSKTWPVQLTYLAELVSIQAKAARGAYQESLDQLREVLTSANPPDENKQPAIQLPVAERLVLAELYYQRLVQADQIELARQAFQMIRERAKAEPIREFAEKRLKELDLVGKPAPAIVGTDVDGQAVQLSDRKGDVVLVVFWATWCQPNTEALPALEEAYQAYKDRGFRILGVNLDAMAEEGRDVKSIRSEVRRFLVEHNIGWPNVVCEPGQVSIAHTYGVTDIPASVLVGRDGKVKQLDLTASNLSRVIERALAEKAE